MQNAITTQKQQKYCSTCKSARGQNGVMLCAKPRHKADWFKVGPADSCVSWRKKAGA